MFESSTQLPLELQDWQKKIEAHALAFGLDFFPVIFEVLDWNQMNMVAAYGGFPNRYPHWSFGMEYERLSKSYSYGLSKIYEMVINNNPCYAYLLHSNNLVDQKLVMAHVYGHCDFFKNNLYFAHTNRKMIDVMANHKTRIKRYMDQYGLEKVEKFIDVCLSVENLIDFHGPFIQRRKNPPKNTLELEEEKTTEKVVRFESKDYMDKFINPPEFLDSQESQKEKEQKFPSSPERDILLFILEHAPLERWKWEVLAMIRDEAYYFLPQRQTKIMNEGWAAYWHSKIMTERALEPSEIIDYADHNAGTLAPYSGSLNPYKLGVELFREIEERWNKGKFGKEYEECDDWTEKKKWNKNLKKGREKIFEVRKLYNDLTFIDTFLTEEFCREQRLFTYDYQKQSNTYQISSRDFQKIKSKLLFSLTNAGQPILSVIDGNYKNRGELYLLHQHDGASLKVEWLKPVLENLCILWGRPVLMETKENDLPYVYCYDGSEHREWKRE